MGEDIRAVGYIRKGSHNSSFGHWHLTDHTWQHLDRLLVFLQMNLGFSVEIQDDLLIGFLQMLLSFDL